MNLEIVCSSFGRPPTAILKCGSKMIGVDFLRLADSVFWLRHIVKAYFSLYRNETITHVPSWKKTKRRAIDVPYASNKQISPIIDSPSGMITRKKGSPRHRHRDNLPERKRLTVKTPKQ